MPRKEYIPEADLMHPELMGYLLFGNPIGQETMRELLKNCGVLENQMYWVNQQINIEEVPNSDQFSERVEKVARIATEGLMKRTSGSTASSAPSAASMPRGGGRRRSPHHSIGVKNPRLKTFKESN
jgi:hypothetical protein